MSTCHLKAAAGCTPKGVQWRACQQVRETCGDLLPETKDETQWHWHVLLLLVSREMGEHAVPYIIP